MYEQLEGSGKQALERKEELEPGSLIRSPELVRWPKQQEMVSYRLRVQLRNLPDTGQVQIQVTADANYLLWVNGSRTGQGPHRNFPGTLVAESYDIRPLLAEGDNEIVALVRHMYVDTFGYLRGEPAFGLWGACGSVDLSTANGSWECRREDSWNEYAARVNMHLGPIEEQQGLFTGWDGAALERGDQKGLWLRPVQSESQGRQVIPSPLPALERTVIEATDGAKIIGTFPALPVQSGTLYAFSRPLELRSQIIAVHIRSEEAGEEEPVFVGIRGLGACLEYADGIRATVHPYGHHLGEGRFTCSGRELKEGLLLYLVGAEHVVLGSATNDVRLSAEVQVRGFIPVPDPLYHFVNIMKELKPAAPLQSFEDDLDMEPAGPARLFFWDHMAGQVKLLPQAVPLTGQQHLPEAFSGQGIVVKLDRFRFGHFRLEIVSEPADEGVLDIAYGYTEDEAGGPQLFNVDRLIWSGTRGVFDNLFTPRGARYLFLSSSVPVRIERITVTEALAPAPDGLSRGGASSIPGGMGSLRTDSPGWNGIWATALETLRYSRIDCISSDSFRELCAWLGDTQHIALDYYYSYYDPAFIRYTWELYARNTDEEGRMFSVVPGYMQFHLPVWTWQFWLGVRNHYLYTGDREFLQGIWPVCLKTYGFFEAFKTEEGLLLNPEGWAIVDWAKIDFAGESFVLNGLYRHAVLALAELAEAAGDEAAKRQFTEAAERIAAALAAPRFYDSGQRLFRDGVTGGRPAGTLSQHAQILAFSMGLWREEEQGSLWSRISDPALTICTLGESSFHWAAKLLSGSPAFVPFIRHLREVYDWKMSLDVACFGHIHPRNTPGDFRYKQNSPAHGWAASPAYVSGAFLLGVTPASAGYKQAVIAPCPAFKDVTEAEGEVCTPFGLIRVSWKSSSGDAPGYIRGEIPDGVAAVLDIRSFTAGDSGGSIVNFSGLQETEAEGMYQITKSSFEMALN